MSRKLAHPTNSQPIIERFARGTKTLLLAVMFLAGLPQAAHAQGLSQASVSRAIEASVLVSVEYGEGRSEGSGTIIHEDGYVLTNFHVVGHVHPFDGGVPGALYREDGVVTLWHSTHSRQESQARWRGRVVRGDPALDLALIRIESTMDGQPVAGTVFPALSIERNPGDLSSAVFAVGYPAGMRSVSINSGQITGFDLDADGQASFIRVDAEFNPGNSGGALVNGRGQLIGVPTQVTRRRSDISPIEKARPVSLIPASWLSQLATGIADVDIELTPLLSPTGNSIRSTGSGLVASNEELFFFRVPRGFSGTVHFDVDHTNGATASGNAALLSLNHPRAPLRTATNSQLAINPRDQEPLLVIVTVRRRTETGAQSSVARIHVRTEPHDLVGTAIAPGGMGQAIGTTTDPNFQPRHEARPDPASYAPAPRLRRNSFYLGGGFVVDPLEGQSFFNGGVARLSYTNALFSTDTAAPVRFALEAGGRLLMGSFRDDFVFSGSVMVGGRLSIGSPELSLELPFAYALGTYLAEDTFSASLYGYELGAFLQTGAIGYGFTWLEAQRGDYSVFRAFNLSLRFQF